MRATAFRPAWTDLPAEVRSLVELKLGSAVVGAVVARSGFTPGFAATLQLARGDRVFLKAASSADDRAHGWSLSSAYRDEAHKLALLPPGIGAPRLFWHQDLALAGEQWILLALEHLPGRPPRRPWRSAELRTVIERLTANAVRLSPPQFDPVVAGLDPVRVETLFIEQGVLRLAAVRARDGASPWLANISDLYDGGDAALTGETLLHFDIRDDNVLIGPAGEVWIVDWNWPALGAPWIDLLCLLLSARGDGLDVERILAENPLTASVPPRSINVFLACMWVYWSLERHKPVPVKSPHLRDHQAWYLEVTQGWLAERLGVERR